MCMLMMMIDVDDDVMCQERGGEEAGNRMANGKKIKNVNRAKELRPLFLHLIVSLHLPNLSTYLYSSRLPNLIESLSLDI